jgi:TRAP-type uncharacterized transport system substrate-binding protein
MKTDYKSGFTRAVTIFSDNFGLNRALSALAVCFICLVTFSAIFWFIHSAPPRVLTITSGPPGSTFERNAEKYRDILARNGVKLKIVPSQGSLENLQRLEKPGSGVDIGFVQGGVSNGTNAAKLVSLGSISYEPLMIFYRGGSPITLLSELEGKRLAIGPAGSGTHSLASTLLRTNGIIAGGATQLLDIDPAEGAKGLLDGTIDAVFLMSDSASSQTMRTLLRSPGVQLFSFEQADAYVRRFNYLNKLRLPEGALDLGKNLPRQDIWLVGPTVELLARPDLNAAMSDLLLEAAQTVHGNASIMQNQGEFPKPLEHEFKISPDASRYYKSGKSFLYRELPFWIASLTNRILVAFIPMMLVLIPGLRLIPAAYKWRIRLRIYRWYRTLLTLERELSTELTKTELAEVHQRLDEIEKRVKRMKVPASFADQFYGLRGHIDYVRQKLVERATNR